MATRVRLGDLLVRAGLITDSDLRVVLAQQKQHGGRIGEHFVRVNLVTEEQMARAIASQLGMAYTDLSQLAPAQVLAMIPQKVAERLQAVATAFEPRTGQLSVALSDPLDDEALAELARITGRIIVPQVSPAIVLRRAIEHAYVGLEVGDEARSELQLVDQPVRAAPPPAPAPVRPAPTASDAGEEALKMIWAMADLLIERGYFSRAELMQSLRAR